MNCAAKGGDGYERVAASMHSIDAPQAVQGLDDHGLHFDHFILRIDLYDNRGVWLGLRRRGRRWLPGDCRHRIFDGEGQGKVAGNFTISGNASVQPERGIGW